MRVTATDVACYNRISVTPVTGSIGAEVENVDLREIDDEIITELHDAWMDHKVLFFRNQELTHAQHVAYGKSFGELEIHPFSPQADGYPEILVLESTPEKFQAAESWHSDVTFRERPPNGSILLARIVPQWGGDTVWANMELAYERLPDDVKELIEDLSNTGAERCWRDMGARTRKEAQGLLKTMLRESFGIEAVRGHARLVIDRMGVMSGNAAAAAKRRSDARYGWWQRRHLQSRLQGFARANNRGMGY